MKNISTIVLTAILFIAMNGVQASDDFVTIAAIFQKTGEGVHSYEEIGIPELRGARYAIDEINQSGGVLGKKLKLIEYDNKSSAIGSKKVALQVAKTDAIAVIGAAWSSHSLAMAPVLQEAKIPMITPVSTNPDVTLVGDYIFRICFIDPFQGTVMANFAMLDLNAKTAVIFTNTSEKYCIELAQCFSDHFKKKGGKVLWEADYNTETSNFSLLLKKMKSLQPDVVFLPGTNRDSGFIIKQARKMGVTIPFLGGDAWNEEMYKYGDKDIEGSYFSSHWHLQSSNEKSKQFVENYQKKMGSFCEAEIPLAYDAVMLLADAIKRANSFQRSKIRDALAATTKFQGTTGNINFDKNRNPVKSAVIRKFENGKTVYLKTIEP